MVITALILTAITVIGLVCYLINLAKLVKRINYIEEFMQKLILLVNAVTTNGRDFSFEQGEEYEWLLENQYKIQMELGVDGVVFYKNPLRGIVDKNHQVIPNFLLEIPPFVREVKQSLYVNSILSENFLRQAEMCINVLSIHKGRLSEAHEQLWKYRFNPLFYFAEGVQTILIVPWLVLKSFGLLSENNYIKITGSKLFKFFAAISAMVGLASSVMGIILGWNEFLDWIKNLYLIWFM